MTTLEVIGWQKGLDVVALIKIVQLYSTGSLSTAKGLAEDVLSGKPVILEFPDEQARDKFGNEASRLGIKFK